MDNKQYALYSQIAFFPSRKPGRTPAYQINPTHGSIAVTNQQHQINIHNYHLVNNINISPKKILVAAINNHWLKEEKYLVVGYTNNTFLEQMEWLDIHYGKIMTVDIMNNQDKMQALYHVGYPIEIFFDQIKTGQ